MPALRTILLLLLLAWAGPALGGAPIPPDEPEGGHILIAFPEFKGRASELSDLRHYRQQLEGYRAGTLEVYNQAIEAYTDALLEFSKKLEALLSKGEIAEAEYERLRELHDQGLRRCRKTGKFMMLYQSAFEKYRSELKWVLHEMLLLASGTQAK